MFQLPFLHCINLKTIKMELTVASWNIEKNGQSSTFDKQSKVSDFIDQCCNNYQISVIFLCEVHSSRTLDYQSYLTATYGDDYYVNFFDGGYSNAYILLIRKDTGLNFSYDTLKYMNRKVVIVHKEDEVIPAVILAHFKSGQTGLTKDQIENAADSLNEMSVNKWAIMGDMNWDYSRVDKLDLGFSVESGSCYRDQTQKSGGILDWCLAGNHVDLIPIDLTDKFDSSMFDMTGPDHKPIIFSLTM